MTNPLANPPATHSMAHSTTAHSTALGYRQSGVDIDAGHALVERIKPHVKKTHRPGVLQGLGGFGALFELPTDKFQQPVLVSGADGVGTKLKLASQLNHHSTIGIDLVAMCVNDIIVCGAEPLYFLDYFATSKLNLEQAEEVIKGIAYGCELAGCALTGGETAEMPGMYGDGDYDLAGFAVGIVEKNKMLNPQNVADGDILIGLASSGVHSNGFSLIRKILEHQGTDLNEMLEGRKIGSILLEPTRIYVKSILKLIQCVPVTAISHITGGGLLENIPRVLPPHLGAKISRQAWKLPAIFSWLQQGGKVAEMEMLRTFNCGIGMVVSVNRRDVDRALESLVQSAENPLVLGEVTTAGRGQVMITD